MNFIYIYILYILNIYNIVRVCSYYYKYLNESNFHKEQYFKCFHVTSKSERVLEVRRLRSERRGTLSKVLVKDTV